MKQCRYLTWTLMMFVLGDFAFAKENSLQATIGDANLQRAKVVLNQAKLLNLTTPVPVIPPMAGKTIIVQYAVFTRHFPIWYTNNPAMYVVYDGPPGACLGIGSPDDPTFNEGNNPDAVFPCPAGYYLNFNFWGGYINPGMNRGVFVVTDTALMGGGPDNTLTIDLFYYLL